MFTPSGVVALARSATSIAAAAPSSLMATALATPNHWVPVSGPTPPTLVRMPIPHFVQIGDPAVMLSSNEAVFVGYDQGFGPNGAQPVALDAVSTVTGRTVWHYGIPYPHKIGSLAWSGHSREFIQFSSGTASPVLVSLSTSGQVLGKTPLPHLTGSDTIDESRPFPQGILLDVIHANGQGATHYQTYSLAFIGYDGKLLWQTASTPEGTCAPGYVADGHDIVWPWATQSATTTAVVLSLGSGRAVFSTSMLADTPFYLADGVVLPNGPTPAALDRVPPFRLVDRAWSGELAGPLSPPSPPPVTVDTMWAATASDGWAGIA